MYVCVCLRVFADVRSNSRYYWNLLIHVWPWGKAQMSLWIRITPIYLTPPLSPSLILFVLVFLFRCWNPNLVSKCLSKYPILCFSRSFFFRSLWYEICNQVICFSQQLLQLTWDICTSRGKNITVRLIIYRHTHHPEVGNDSWAIFSPKINKDWTSSCKVKMQALCSCQLTTNIFCRMCYLARNTSTHWCFFWTKKKEEGHWSYFHISSVTFMWCSCKKKEDLLLK